MQIAVGLSWSYSSSELRSLGTIPLMMRRMFLLAYFPRRWSSGFLPAAQHGSWWDKKKDYSLAVSFRKKKMKFTTMHCTLALLLRHQKGKRNPGCDCQDLLGRLCHSGTRVTCRAAAGPCHHLFVKMKTDVTRAELGQHKKTQPHICPCSGRDLTAALSSTSAV